MAEFQNILFNWFNKNKRDLPWRNNHNPYRVWISEIILQQTRVDQGLPYYFRFVERFPDLESLASASEKDVLLMWQGLGYYSRARNLHYAALQIKNEYGGQFPERYEEILKLKGIGIYTASAIASISFGLPHAVVDGNVYRILSRIFGNITPVDSSSGKKEYNLLAGSLLDKKEPGLFNEAMMEFGALQCIPKNPDCGSCPFKEMCVATLSGRTGELPVRSGKQKIRNRYFYFLKINFRHRFYIQKRVTKDIWQNLYQLPLIETNGIKNLSEIMTSCSFKELFEGLHPVIESVPVKAVHNLTHQKIHIQFIDIYSDTPLNISNCILIDKSELYKYPFPKPITDYLKS